MTDPATIRSWFNEHGWQLEPADLRAALHERGADQDTIIELLDEGADRRRAQTDQERATVPLAYTPAEHTLGALLLAGAMSPAASAAVLDQVEAVGLTADCFHRERDRLIYQAILAIVARREPADWLIVERELGHKLDQAGGRGYIRELANMAPATANAYAYARAVVEEHRRTQMEHLGLRVTEAARNGGISPELRDELSRLADQPLEEGLPPEAVDAGAFIFDEPDSVDGIRLWGDDTQIGWAAGEGLMLVGPDGVGKTTLGQQLALARAGLRSQALGMNVEPDPRRILYIAADRPRQAARSMRRMVGDLERDQLNERMTVWRGPLPRMLNEDRTILVRLAKTYDAGTIVVDSLKDVAVDLATDEAGGRIASAFQHAIATGLEILVMHHPRKPGVDQHRKPKELSDVYGSRLIFGAFGSVIMLWGNPGDPIIELSHLKQPVDELGPWNIRHDHPHGHTERETGTDLVQLVLNSSTAGLTAQQAAEYVYEKTDVSKNEIERTRAKLDRLVQNGRLIKLPGKSGPGGHSIYLFNGPQEALQ